MTSSLSSSKLTLSLCCTDTTTVCTRRGTHAPPSNLEQQIKVCVRLRMNLLYKDESMCVCVYVCMSGGLPPDIHNLSPQNFAWAPHLARHRTRGRPQMLTPGGTPYSDPVWKPWRVKNWVEASKQKLLLGVGLYIKILFVGGSPQPKARRVLRSICTGLFHNEIVK